MTQLTKARRLALLSRHRGLLQRVAERCRVDPSLVSRVFHGKATSARVEKELTRALSKVAPRRPRRKPAFRWVKPVDLSRQTRWLEKHGAEYAGQWVALDGDRLIASSANAKDVFEAARRAGVAVPFVEHVQPPDALPFGGW